MESHLRAFGWTDVEVIDEDLGRSAGGSMTRIGFERMVTQVCLGEVGAVCAGEVSRFARNSSKWQQLLEVCRLVDTLLVDQETVHSPRQSNDRLLLGLKGTLNEYELDLLRQRASEARVEKARRDELVSQLSRCTEFADYGKDDHSTARKSRIATPPCSKIGSGSGLVVAFTAEEVFWQQSGEEQLKTVLLQNSRADKMDGCRDW